jgi:hypothetical protein
VTCPGHRARRWQSQDSTPALPPQKKHQKPYISCSYLLLLHILWAIGSAFCSASQLNWATPNPYCLKALLLWLRFCSSFSSWPVTLAKWLICQAQEHVPSVWWGRCSHAMTREYDFELLSAWLLSQVPLARGFLNNNWKNCSSLSDHLVFVSRPRCTLGSCALTLGGISFRDISIFIVPSLSFERHWCYMEEACDMLLQGTVLSHGIPSGQSSEECS